MSTVFETVSELIRGLDVKDLSEINSMVVDEINRENGRLNSIAKRRFQVDDEVWFMSKKRGSRVEGRITKINRKNISLLTNDSRRWSVAPALLNLK